MDDLKINNHCLVPKHSKISEEEKTKLFEKYNISVKQLPKIFKTDSAIAELNPKIGDIIVIERNSPIVGKTYFYRVVVNG